MTDGASPAHPLEILDRPLVQTATVRFTFEGCELDLGRYEVRRDGDVIAVEPQVFDVLVHLVRHRDRVVSKEELLDEVWGDRFVGESALTSRIKAARRAVGDDGDGPARDPHRPRPRLPLRRRRGRRWLGMGTDVEPASARSSSDIQFCTTPDGVQLAYAAVGQGPPLVKVANWLTPPRLRLGEPCLAALVARPVARTTGWCGTTSGAAGCPTGMSTTSRSTRGSATSRRSSTPPASSGSRCSASHRAARSP